MPTSIWVAVTVGLLWLSIAWDDVFGHRTPDAVRVPGLVDVEGRAVRQWIMERYPSLDGAVVTEVWDALQRAAAYAGPKVDVLDLAAMAVIESDWRPWAHNEAEDARGVLQVRRIAFVQVLNTYPEYVSWNMWQAMYNAPNGALVGALYYRWIRERGYTRFQAWGKYNGGSFENTAYALRVKDMRDQLEAAVKEAATVASVE